MHVPTPQPGDHIRTFTGLYWHHGIYIGNGQVIDLPKGPGSAVRTTGLPTFASGNPVEPVPHSSSLPSADVVRRARSQLGLRRYDLFTWNCEHFATWCKCGSPSSAQAQALGLAAGALLLAKLAG